MPSIAPACLVVALITATLGCSTKKDEGPASEPEHARTAEQRETAKVEAQEAKQALQDYAYAQKAEFIAQMKKDLAETEPGARPTVRQGRRVHRRGQGRCQAQARRGA